MSLKKILLIVAKYAAYLCLVIVISFVLPRLIPGSPLNVLAGEGSGYTEMVPAALLEPFEQYFAPTEPMHVQFFRYVRNLCHFDLGISLFHRTPVADRIAVSIRWTLQLTVPTIVISTVLGLLLGVSMGLMKKKRGALLVPPLLTLQSIPTFLMGALAQIVLAYRLRLFPAIGSVTPGMLPGDEGYFLDMLEHMILPLSILIISEIPAIAIFSYNSTLRVKDMPYVSFAKYMNIDAGKIRWQYIVRNIMPDFLGRLNIQVVTCIVGSLFVETIFSYPGVGSLLRHAINYRDYTLMQGVLLVCSLYGVIINFLFDIINTRLASKS